MSDSDKKKKKTSWEKEKMLVSKGLFLRVVKTRDCLEKG